MKLSMLFGLLVLANTATAANLGTVRMNYYTEPSKSIQLRDCHGSMQVTTNVFGEFGLSVVGNDNCTNVIVNNAKVKAEEGFFSGVRRAFVPLVAYANGQNTYDITLESNERKTSDRVTLIVDTRRAVVQTSPAVVTLRQGQGYDLPSCGGRVEFRVQNGQANLVFRRVEQCSNFDILSANGDAVDYPNQKLQGTDGARSGSFTLPRRVIDYGSNSVTVIVKSGNNGPNGKRDRVRLVFPAR